MIKYNCLQIVEVREDDFMKKLLSVLLCVTMAVSLVTASTATTFAQSNDYHYHNEALIENFEDIFGDLEIKEAKKAEKDLSQLIKHNLI